LDAKRGRFTFTCIETAYFIIGINNLKLSPMNASTMFEYELGLWKRILFNIEEENILLKYKISELLNQIKISPERLSLIEHFQNLFVLSDNTTRLFENDFYKHLNEINTRGENDKIEVNLISVHQKFRKEIQQIEANHNLIKFQFCERLSK